MIFVLNTEGVFQLQPRVTPWVSVGEIRCNPEGVGQPNPSSSAKTGLVWRTPSVFHSLWLERDARLPARSTQGVTLGSNWKKHLRCSARQTLRPGICAHFSKTMLSTTTVPFNNFHLSQNTPTVMDVNFLSTSRLRSSGIAHSGWLKVSSLSL